MFDYRPINYHQFHCLDGRAKITVPYTNLMSFVHWIWYSIYYEIIDSTKLLHDLHSFTSKHMNIRRCQWDLCVRKSNLIHTWFQVVRGMAVNSDTRTHTHNSRVPRRCITIEEQRRLTFSRDFWKWDWVIVNRKYICCSRAKTIDWKRKLYWKVDMFEERYLQNLSLSSQSRMARKKKILWNWMRLNSYLLLLLAAMPKLLLGSSMWVSSFPVHNKPWSFPLLCLFAVRS